MTNPYPNAYQRAARAGSPAPLTHLLLAGTLGLLTAGSAVAQTPTFAPITAYNTGGGGQPQAVAVADVNADGQPDLLTADGGGNAVSVLLSNGAGTFQPQQAYATGGNTNPYAIAAGDVNGDGRPDLVTANFNGASASVLLGNGNGTFQAPIIYAVGSRPRSIALADVNGDGRSDLMTANTSSNTLSVLLNNGNGTFSAAVDYATGTQPRGLAVADVNGDGQPDLVTANYNDNTAGVLLNAGNGTFQPVVSYAVGAEPSSVALADVNGDGQPDLLVAHFGDNTAGVLLNAGNGTFQPVVSYSTGPNGLSPYSIVVADVNADSQPDLLTANFNDKTVSVLPGNGNGTFGVASNYASSSTTANPMGLAVADLNADGQPDLTVANSSSSTVSVLLNSSTGTFPAAVDYSTGAPSTPYGVAAADVNADGKPDLLSANTGSGSLGVSLNNGNGTFGALTTYSTGTNSSPIRLVVADVNADGRPDLLSANVITNSAGVFLGNGNGTFQPMVTYPSGGNNPYGIAVGDVNADSRPDLLLANYAGNNVGVLLGNGDGTFQAAVAYAVSVNPASVAVADVNADGKPDLLTGNAGNGTTGVLLGNGDGTFGVAMTYPTGGNNPFTVAAADVNADGQPDLLAANYGSGTLGVLLGNGNGTFGAAVTYPTGGGNPFAVVAADVNVDGKPDLLTGNAGSGTTGVLLGNGDGTFQAPLLLNTGSGSQPLGVAVADVNADNKPDVLAALAGTGAVGVLLNTSPAPLPVELTQFTAAPEGPAAVRLAWATASEKNSTRFDVERSADGRTFTRIGQAAAAGSSSAPRSYELLDAKLPTGAATLYYRLKQVDADGTFSYSLVRTVTLTGAAAGLALYPNPTHDGAATLTGAQPGTVVTVFDALGRPVAAATADAAGTAALVLPAGLATGVYVVRVGSQAVRLTVE